MKDDTISRQAAIDELSLYAEMLMRVLDDLDVVGNEREKYTWGLGVIEECIKDMKELPSSQPEQRWILVTEKLPEECGEYLVTKKDVGWNCEEYYKNDITYWDTSFHKANEVVAWMPLPEPYRENKE